MQNYTAISEIIKANDTDSLASLRAVIKETAKAFCIQIDDDKVKTAWFPKSVCPSVVDDFYAEKSPNGVRLVPDWIRSKKAAEIGILPWRV